jgi:EAL domain-containing protein (putative c-di-GMP-specific phosphodiesterase class I)
LRVVAEGVENAEAWRRLVLLGCDVAQGFHLSRPIPSAALVAWLHERERMAVVAGPSISPSNETQVVL